MGKKHLTSDVKMGYYMTMFTDFISFILRILLIVALWVFVWKILEPRTQLMRILRAVVLLLGLLGVLVVLRMTGRWLSSFKPTSFYFGVLYSVLVPLKIEPCRNLVRGHLVVKKSLHWISRSPEGSRRDSRRAEWYLSRLINAATPKPSKENFGHRPAMAFCKKKVLCWKRGLSFWGEAEESHFLGYKEILHSAALRSEWQFLWLFNRAKKGWGKKLA